MRDITVDRPVDQSHFECNVCPWKSHLKRKMLHFNLTQYTEITHSVSPRFKHKSTSLVEAYSPAMTALRTKPAISGVSAIVIFSTVAIGALVLRLSWYAFSVPRTRRELWVDLPYASGVGRLARGDANR